MSGGNAITPVSPFVLEQREDKVDMYGNPLCGLPNLYCSCGYHFSKDSPETSCPKCFKEREKCKNRVYAPSEKMGVPMCYVHYNIYYGVLGGVLERGDQGYIDELFRLVEGLEESGLVDLKIEAQQAKMAYEDLIGSDASPTKKLQGFKDLAAATVSINKLAVEQNLIEDFINNRVRDRLIYAKAVAYQIILSLFEKMFGKDKRMELLKERLFDLEPQISRILPDIEKKLKDKL